MRTLPVLVACLLTSVGTSVGPASAASWVLAEGDAQTVGFRSKAPLESFEGTTHKVRGRIVLNPASIGDTIELEVRVDMGSLDTGIAMRNRHMRENHLHTDRFPHATFRGGTVTEGKGTNLGDLEPHDVTVTGELDLHGVSREISVTLTLQLENRDSGEAGALRIGSEFPVALADHDIPRPGFLFAKLGKIQRVFARLVADPAGEARAGPENGPLHPGSNP